MGENDVRAMPSAPATPEPSPAVSALRGGIGIAAHTPGPWVLSRKESRISAYLIGANGSYITSFPIPADYWNEPEGWDRTRDAADARLIALCPEMFEYIESSASNGCATAKSLIARADITRGAA